MLGANGSGSTPPQTPGRDYAAVAVSTHVTMLQSAIARMASNSAACKTWTVTLVAGILVVAAGRPDASVAWIALLPTFAFAGMDAYYLALERAFRHRYRDFVQKLHQTDVPDHMLFDIDPSPLTCQSVRAALVSFAVWPFYGPMVVGTMVVALTGLH